MQFSKLVIASALALISSVSSQVVVTVTNTVTVVTVTVTPLSTSTSIVTVTVPGTPYPTTKPTTSTSIVTVTVSAPAQTTSAACPGAEGVQCGGFGRYHCSSCGAGLTCSRVNGFYSQCVSPPRVTTIVTTIYGGLLTAAKA